jgi:hypothetical protein
VGSQLPKRRRRRPAIARPVAGEIAAAINHLVRQYKPFASEVMRISREIGLQGRFGGQAIVEDCPGTWQDLVTNLNVMTAHLIDQVRDIAEKLAQGLSADTVTVPA